MDGTLLATDMLFESFLRVIKKQPWKIVMVFFWLIQGRSVLKSRLAKDAAIDVGVLPLHDEVVAFLKEEKARGRKLVLATASNKVLADAVASRVGIFDEVLSSSDESNLKASAKAAVLVDRYGHQGFDYVGNDRADYPVWRESHTAHVVNNNETFCVHAQQMGVEAGRKFYPDGLTIKVFFKAIRIHQWVKNVLVFVPVLMAHQFGDAEVLLKTILGFFAFGFCASSVYLLNDMMDLDDDRHHRSKKYRPIAAGTFPVVFALVLFPVLFLAGFLTALFCVSLPFALLLALYYALTLAYSFSLKRMLLIDVIVLAGLYTSRIVGGALAAGVVISSWLVSFSVFVFLSLALVKRYAELLVLQESGGAEIKGRGYAVDDLPTLLSLGTASAYLSVLVMALYIDSQKVTELYANSWMLWLLCPIMLYWISRIWMLTHRGQMHDDPIVFAIKDPVSRVTGIIMLLIIVLAI